MQTRNKGNTSNQGPATNSPLQQSFIEPVASSSNFNPESPDD